MRMIYGFGKNGVQYTQSAYCFGGNFTFGVMYLNIQILVYQMTIKESMTELDLEPKICGAADCTTEEVHLDG